MDTKRKIDAINSLPIQLGIRLVLDSICYSNALPDWFETAQINYGARERAIRRRIQAYLEKARPEPSFKIGLPRKSGEIKSWSIPSINDQIIVQTCVSSIAKDLFERAIDRRRVFSYRYSSNSDKLALTEDHIAGWRAFQRETHRRCSSGECVLQIDLEEAFGSINRVGFFYFLREFFPGRIEVDLLEILLESFGENQPGLPLVNDSIFFLGNVYLSVVDKIVQRHSANFIRFVDDYRIFGNSQAALQAIATAIDPELQGLGFRVNRHKLRLGTGESYLESLSRVRYAETDVDGIISGDAEWDEELASYPGSVKPLAGIIPPAVMIAQINSVLDRADQNLNEGRGRFLMGVLRRMRVDALVVEGRSDGDNGRPALRRHFSGQLSKNRSVLQKIHQLLNVYAERPEEIWRLTWLLYLIKDIDFGAVDRRLSLAISNRVAGIRSTRSVPVLARLWASNVMSVSASVAGQVEKLHERGYIQSGQLLLEGENGEQKRIS
jgi:hypothetical protein